MDLVSIARKLWRFKLVTLPVVLLTLCGAVYVVAVKEPVYEASSSYILINPPAPPTAEDVAGDPALGRINSDNPYTRFSDQSVIVEVLASSMAGKATQQALLKAGADPRYKVAPTSAFGYSSPIVQITAQGASPAVAIGSAKLVGDALNRELAHMQQAEGVDSHYRIKAQQVDAPDGAQLRASGQLRMLVGVLALGVVLLFVVVSLADAVTTLRTERIGRAAPSRLAANGEPWSARDDRAEGLSALDPEDWSELDEEPADSDQLINLFPDHDPERTVPTDGLPPKQRPHRRMQRRFGR
jgi:capsular polysaccharide biosynthesis protein